jgi:hypothetical protein
MSGTAKPASTRLTNPTQKLPTPTVPMTNGYDERDKNERVIHSRAQQPFKTMSQTKSALSGQKSGF